MRSYEKNDDKTYSKGAIEYLKYLDKQKSLNEKYNELAYNSLKELYAESLHLNFTLEKRYLDLLAQVSNKNSLASESDVNNLKMTRLSLT